MKILILLLASAACAMIVLIYLIGYVWKRYKTLLLERDALELLLRREYERDGNSTARQLYQSK